jgi:choline dehydrogenase
MISGVGPKGVLQNLGIEVVSQLEAVGQNLEDHLLFGASYQVKPVTHSALSDTDYFSSASEQYAKYGTGMLSNPGGEILAWEKLPSKAEASISDIARDYLKSVPQDWPDFEFLMLDAYSGDNQNYVEGAPKTPFMYASPAAAIMVQQSRGNITISSTDTTDPPVINPNWLTHPIDQEISLQAFKRMREMMDTEEMQKAWIEEVLPGRNVSTNADIMDAIRRTAIQVFHASCTCKNFFHTSRSDSLHSSC